MGWSDGFIGKVFALQTWGRKFKLLEPILKNNV